MGILERVISLVAPHECLNCGRENELLCADCLKLLLPCRPFEHPLHHLTSLTAVTPYAGAAKQLVWSLKSAGARLAADNMADAMAGLVKEADFLIPAPTATDHARQRGYDQARLLAKALSKKSGVAYLDGLRRLGKVHQIGAARTTRLRQLNGAFYVKKSRLIRGSKIILVDDVVTTGATLEAAAQVLLQAGAKKVRAITFAQTL